MSQNRTSCVAKEMNWCEFIIKFIFTTSSLFTIISGGLWTYYWWGEYQSLREDLITKSTLKQTICIQDEIKSNQGLINQCKEWDRQILELSQDLWRKAIANTMQTLRLCGGVDCSQYFASYVYYLGIITQDIVWFVIQVAFSITLIFLMATIGIYICFGRLHRAERLKEVYYGGSGMLPSARPKIQEIEYDKYD